MLISIMFDRGLRVKDNRLEIRIVESYRMVTLTAASAQQKIPSLLGLQEMKNCRVVKRATHVSQIFKATAIAIAFPSLNRKYNQLVNSIELHINDISSRLTLWKD